jgi:succinyl-diaminopimelate desuccinylase
MDELLQQLVAIPSVSGHYEPSKQIMDFCANYLRDRGMYVTEFVENNFPSLITTTRKTKTPTLMLAGHLDVVPAPEHMFKLRLESGIYYGRGVWDMKNNVASYLRIVDELKDNLSDYDFGIMLTSDEEPFGNYGTGMLTEKGYLPKVAYLPDAIESWHIQTFAKGCWFAEISALGVSAHGSRPWEGDSASIRLVRILERIAKLFEQRQQRETATLNIGIIRSGEQINQIPASALATLDIRYVEPDDMSAIVSEINAICDAEGATIRTVREDDGPVNNDITDPYMAAFADCMESFLGHKPETVRQCGTSDARYFSKHNIPVILTSPIGGGYHSDDEWLDAADYERFHQLLKTYVDRVAKNVSETPAKALTATA